MTVEKNGRVSEPFQITAAPGEIHETGFERMRRK